MQIKCNIYNKHCQWLGLLFNLCPVHVFFLVFLISGVQQNFAFLEELYSSIARQVFGQQLKTNNEAP